VIKVLVDDDGIRPAGKPDECFYCQRKVGDTHKEDCVTVVQIVKYAVYVEGKQIGTFICAEPFHWDESMSHFHKNEGTWCADNAIGDDFTWTNDHWKKVITEGGEGCCCSLMRFEQIETIHPGPLRGTPDADKMIEGMRCES